MIPFSAPPAKIPRITGPGTLSFSKSCRFAGEAFDEHFPEAKSLLNNSLQSHLQRLNKKLEYTSKRVVLPNGLEISRCTLCIPYPKPFTVVGEGSKAKDAERRAAAVACFKLQEGGFLQQGSNVANKLTEVEEDKQPRLVELSVSSQLQLFDVVSSLPQCKSFACWDSIAKHFPKGNSATMLALPFNSQGDSYEITLQSADEKEYKVVNQSVSLSQPLSAIVARGGILGPVACPCCQKILNMCVTSKAESAKKSPLLPFPSPDTTQSTVTTNFCDSNQRASVSERDVICAFSGLTFLPPKAKLCQERNLNLQLRQQTIEKTYQSSLPDSAICIARNLPISTSRNLIVTEVNSCQVVIISGATGSGKTTQTPQYILENYVMYGVGSNCNIIITQPRRISAISNAERVAEERGEKVGDTVGYQVRMESCVPPAPGRILYCTTGVLLTKLRINPKLQGVSHIIVDEVHERDINTDFLLILLSEMVREGLPVKIVLMSASIDVNILVSYFQRAGAQKVPCLSVEGRLFPVTSHYLEDITKMIGWKREAGTSEPATDVDLVVAVVTHVLRTTSAGALLVFLPGWEDISSVQCELQSKLQHEGLKIVIYPLHSMISVGDQQKVFSRPPLDVRKVILSTNIAETSLTINDVVWVINTGTVKVRMFDPARRVSCLNIKWCSKSSILQRTGRAGRCQPGHCFNLFTRRQQSLMEEYELPQMHMLPLEEIVLQSKIMKSNQRTAEFLTMALTPPPLSAATIAVKALTDLGALDAKENLTVVGRMLALLPVEPRVGKLILYGVAFRTLNPILTIAASFGYKDPFLCPPSKCKEADMARLKLAEGCCSDHILITKAYDGWRKSIDASNESDFIQNNFLHRGTLLMIHGIRKQFLTQLRSFGFDVDSDSLNQFSDSDVMIRAVLMAGLYPNVIKVAKMMESGGTRGNTVKRRVRNGCKTLQDGRVFFHPSSVNSDNLPSSAWFVYFEKVKTSKVQVKDCTLIDPVHMLLFGGNTLTKLNRSDGHVEVRIDDIPMYAFVMQPKIVDLLTCAREEIQFMLEKILVETPAKPQDVLVQHNFTRFLVALEKFLSCKYM